MVRESESKGTVATILPSVLGPEGTSQTLTKRSADAEERKCDRSIQRNTLTGEA